MENGDKVLRVLCLHGFGNNNKVFEAQTAALRNELGDGFEWTFVEGTIPVPMDSALKGYFPEEEQYFSYFDLHDPESLATALGQLERYIIDDGDYDFIAGMSAGALLAATLLSFKAQESPEDNPLFKGAFFFSGLEAFDYAAFRAGNMLRANPQNDFKIAIPSANIWSARDEFKAVFSPQLAASCSPEVNVNFVHQHVGIPGASDEAGLVGAAHAIRRTVDFALEAK